MTSCMKRECTYHLRFLEKYAKVAAVALLSALISSWSTSYTMDTVKRRKTRDPQELSVHVNSIIEDSHVLNHALEDASCEDNDSKQLLDQFINEESKTILTRFMSYPFDRRMKRISKFGLKKRVLLLNALDKLHMARKAPAHFGSSINRKSSLYQGLMLVANALQKHDNVSPERYDVRLLGLHDDLARKVGQIMIENDGEFKSWILSPFIELCPYITYQFKHETILTARISQEGDQICVVTTDQENYTIRDFDASMNQQSQTEIDVKQLPGYVADVAYEYDAWVLSSCRQKLAFLRSVDGIAQLLVYDRTNQSTLIFDYEGCFLKSSLAFSSDNSKIMFITQDEQARKARLYAFSITDGLLLYEKIYQLPEIYAPLISDSGSYVAVITGIPEQTAPAAYHYAQHLCHLMVPQTGKHYVFYLDGRESVTDTALEHVWLDQSERFMYISSVQGIFCIELPCLETKVLDLESYPRIDYDSISEQAEWIGIHKETILMTDKDRLELANVHKEITCTFKHGIKNIQLLDFAANIFLIGGIDGHHSDVGLWNMDHLLDVLKQLHELSLEQILLLSDIYQCSKNEELYVVVGQQMKQLYMSLPLFAREYVESREHVLVLEDDQEFSAR